MVLKNGSGWKMISCDFDRAGMLMLLDEVQDTPNYNSVFNYMLGISLTPDQMTVYYVPKIDIAYIYPSSMDSVNFDADGKFVGQSDSRYELRNWKGLGVMSVVDSFRNNEAQRKILIEKSYVITDEDSVATKIAKMFLNTQSIEIKGDTKTVNTFNSIDADIRNKKLSFNKFLQLINLMNGGYEVTMTINKKDMTADGGYKATPVTSFTL